MVRFLVAAVHVSIPGISDLDRNVETADSDFICDMAFSHFIPRPVQEKLPVLGANVRFDRSSVSGAAGAWSVFGQIIEKCY
jgi:hypothetical protein